MRVVGGLRMSIWTTIISKTTLFFILSSSADTFWVIKEGKKKFVLAIGRAFFRGVWKIVIEANHHAMRIQSLQFGEKREFSADVLVARIKS